MSVEEDKKALARYRLDQAEESLDEARYLVSGDKSPRSIINRAYYSMFYAILALLIREPFSSSKHSGILRYFNRSFIKTGILDRELGRWVNKAFELRQRVDYREYFEVTSDQADGLLENAEKFVSIVRGYIDAR
ncbi:MAG: HEPN domain-containing protein [Chloroflexi bacterium]|nr:HEPN domain-containing protein [Chloroflexota bacterium]